MKKVFSFAVSIFLFFSLAAQKNNISYGPRVGLSIIPVEKNEANVRSYRLGMSAGGFFDYKVNHWFSVRAELNYAMKKQNNRSADTVSLLDNLGGLIGIDTGALQLPAGVNLNVYSNTASNITLHYLEIPLLGVFHLKNVKIMAGPYIGIVAGAKTQSELTQDIPLLSLIDLSALGNEQLVGFFLNQFFPGYNSPDISESKGTSGLNKIDVGITADITYQLENNLNFGFRFQRGFIDYRENAVGDNKFNISFQFLIGYRFGKSKNEGPIIKPRANTGEN